MARKPAEYFFFFLVCVLMGTLIGTVVFDLGDFLSTVDWSNPRLIATVLGGFLGFIAWIVLVGYETTPEEG